MKRIQKPIIAVILILVMVMNCSVALAAGSSLTTQQKAEALKTLHLFQGTDKGFELDKTLTREQAVTLIVRLLGAEEEALEKKPAHPFTDVWEWANPYVGYAYCNGITKGTGNNIFGYGEHVTEAQFLTMILRVLQYEDDADFTWDSPYALAERLGLPVVRAESGTYTRGNAVDVIWALLGVQFKSGNQTLAEALIAKGVFTLESYKEVCGTSNSDSGRPSNSGWPVIQPKPDEPVDPEIPDDPEEPDGLVVYVAADGDDSGAGTKDAPFRTLEAARDYVRSNNTDKQPVTVFLRGGEYVLSQTFTLTAEDSGTAEAPVSYRAYPDEEVVISGSGAVSFQAFTPVTGEMKDKLPTEDAQNHVMVADIRDLGIDSISVGLTDSNFRIQAPLMMLDGHQLSLTRYPNSDSTEDWLKVNTVAPTQATGTYPTIQFEDETVWGWEHNTDDLIYFGFFSYGWALHGFHGEMDPQTKTVAATDSSHYGSSSGEKPVQIYNAYESMDEPGEWYYDRQTGKLYIYPFDDTTAASELWVTQGNFDLISVEDAAYISRRV